jgi:hypothetical protein
MAENLELSSSKIHAQTKTIHASDLSRAEELKVRATKSLMYDFRFMFLRANSTITGQVINKLQGPNYIRHKNIFDYFRPV